LARGMIYTCQRIQALPVPETIRILHRSTSADSSVLLQEESLVPLAVDTPVLHGMRHIGRLNDVFNHNCRAEVIIIFVGQIALRKCRIPSILAKAVELLIKDISRKHNVDEDLAETSEFGLIEEQASAQTFKLVGHEQIPSRVKRLMFGVPLLWYILANSGSPTISWALETPR
jgi:hypothetical protein